MPTPRSARCWLFWLFLPFYGCLLTASASYVAWDWAKSGVIEMNCFLCHMETPNNQARVAAIEYDPNRNARIALLHYLDGEKRYIIAPSGVKVGDTIESGPKADIRPGNAAVYYPEANVLVPPDVDSSGMMP